MNTAFTVKGLEGRYGSILLKGDNLTAIQDLPREASGSLYFALGLMDCQVNGYVGVDFNNAAELDSAAIEKATLALWSQGVTRYLATIISNFHKNILRIIRTFQKVENPLVQKSIAGFHIEGPFLSAEEDVRGVHSPEYITTPSLDWVQEWQEASGNRVKIITFSPHWEDSYDFVSFCNELGIRVSIGHTHARPDQIHQAASWGCDLSTHLGNGCHNLLPRHSNYIWAQLAESRLWCSFIADGFHIPIDIIKVILACKAKKAFIVSDVTSLGGMEPGCYHALVGGKVCLTEEGKLHVVGKEYQLAGSAQSLLGAVKFLVNHGILNLADAWELASQKPQEYLYSESSDLSLENRKTDFVLLSNNLNVEKTFIDNKLVYTRNPL